jgi:phosphate transport system substrate-binding protein
MKVATGLVIAAGATGGFTAVAGADVSTTITGAGSTLVAPLMANCHGCVQIPWALTATAVAFNVPGVHTLKLTGPILADIYLGKIGTWNNKRIAKINKGVKLPNLAITPVYRSDGSGDTYVMTDYLSRVSSPWKSQVGNATSVSFPKGVGGKGNDGVTAVVASTKGSIGYVSAYYAIQHKLGVAALKNNAGKFEYPNLGNIKSAASAVRRVPSNNEMHIVNPPRSAKIAYVMSTFTYAIVPTTSPKADAIKALVRYAVSSVGQRFAPALDFQTIPKVVVRAAKGTVAKIHT